MADLQRTQVLKEIQEKMVKNPYGASNGSISALISSYNDNKYKDFYGKDIHDKIFDIIDYANQIYDSIPMHPYIKALLEFKNNNPLFEVDFIDKEIKLWMVTPCSEVMELINERQ
jgi:hypothetical protein